MIDFLKDRQNVIDDISEKEINLWIEKMLNYLGGDIWLKKSRNVDHPIVKLWNRRDFMATNELVNFANAVNITFAQSNLFPWICWNRYAKENAIC